MHATIIVGHPSTSSFSHALAAAAQQVLVERGYIVHYHDLYAERFEPVLLGSESANVLSDDPLVEQHCAEIAAADLIVICHPNWWGQPPAILKGWIDRVLRPGVGYDYRDGSPADVPVGLLRARAALVFNTSNTPADRKLAVFGDPLETIWRNCVFGFCGVRRFARRVFGPVFGSTPEVRSHWLVEAADLVKQHID
jgi:putative NADPH-quinone reductase